MSKRNSLVMLVLLIVVVTGCSTSQKLNRLSDLYKQNLSAVVTVINNTVDGVYGTGYVVDKQKGLIVTASHLIRNRKTFTVKFEWGAEALAFIKVIDYENDIAFIKVDPKFLKTKLNHALELELNPVIGDYIFSIGSPGKFNGTISFGILSRNLTYTKDFHWAKFPLGLYLSDIHVFGGSSGCPVFNLENKLIGIVVGYIGYNKYATIAPAFTIQKLLKEYADN